MDNQITFMNGGREVYNQLRLSIDLYFKQKNKTQYADQRMQIKVIFGLLGLLSTYLLVISGYLSGVWLFGAALLHGLMHLFIAFNIAHDANHGAISPKPHINRLLSYTLDLIGVSSWLWKIAHNEEHHNFVNVKGKDNNIYGFGLFRFTPAVKLRSHFRFQHLYSFFFYGLTTFNYVTFKDFLHLYKRVKLGKRLSVSQAITMVIFKVFYFIYVIYLPMKFLDLSIGMLFLSFFVIHFVIGHILAFVFQCGHLTEEAHFPKLVDGQVQDSWTVHVIKSTGDFAADNIILTWLVGGINIHIIHHLFPTICHVHYRELIPTVRQVIQKSGYPYREVESFTKAIISHLNMIHHLGNHEHQSIDKSGSVAS